MPTKAQVQTLSAVPADYHKRKWSPYRNLTRVEKDHRVLVIFLALFSINIHFTAALEKRRIYLIIFYSLISTGNCGCHQCAFKISTYRPI